tara:strand:- start:63628 stop:64560 length:933 start_codon:yes stop_codon:yes gene_type:complete
MAYSSRRGGIRLWLAGLVFLLAVALPVWFAVAALGVKFEFWDYQVGLGTLTRDWGAKFTTAVLLAGLVLLLLGLIKAPRVRTVILSILILLIAGLCMGRLLAMKSVAESLPPIHDVQTDWSDPIMFTDAMMELRGDESNPVQADPVISPVITRIEQNFEAQKEKAQSGGFSKFMWDTQVALGMQSDVFYWKDLAGQRVADEQARAYPEIEPIIVAQAPDTVFQVAEEVLASMDMEFVTRSQGRGILEATASTQWFGFKDDVAVRIRPEGDGSRVDIRSVSRVGLSDLGANAKRVEAISNELESRLSEQAS